MKTIVGKSDLQKTVALSVRHLEKMHGGKIHTHHQLHLLSLLRVKEIAMNGRGRQEDALTKIEIVARCVVVEIGVETKESRKAHEKHQMEIGKVAVLPIEPLDTISDIIEKQGILLFTPQSIIEKLRDEKGDGKFVRIKGNGGEGMEQAHIGEFLQLEFWSDISLNLQYCQRLEELLFHLPFG